MRMGLLSVICAARWTSVAGGQTSTSAAIPPASSIRVLSRPSCSSAAPVPFIFQFPAISGCIDPPTTPCTHGYKGLIGRPFACLRVPMVPVYYARASNAIGRPLRPKATDRLSTERTTMLDNFRNFGRSWIAKVLLGILIIAVAGFGIPSVFLDLNANTVARVGDQNISVRDFDRVYRSQVNLYTNQMGRAPTAQEALSFGLPNAAIARLANDASLVILAVQLDLGASDAKLAELVRRDPSFASAVGIFDASEFTAMLRQSGYTESEYLNLQRRASEREQL